MHYLNIELEPRLSGALPRTIERRAAAIAKLHDRLAQAMGETENFLSSIKRDESTEARLEKQQTALSRLVDLLYRWDLANNTLSQNVRLTSGLGEAYTPTLVGADGAVYAINNATLFSVGEK